MNQPRAGVCSAVLLVLLSLVGCSSSRFPEVSEEGLIRVGGTRFDAVYRSPTRDPFAARTFVVEPCTVTFRDSWLREQNLNRAPGRQVTVEDMRRIEEELAAACRSVFVERLADLEDVRIVEEGAAGALALRPAIVDLDVAAPDVTASGRERTYTTSAGSMTLKLEIANPVSGEIVGRVFDRREATDAGQLRLTTSVSNQYEADRILKLWASELVELLASAQR